ncbi:MAG: transglycosylase SLT domain-containing protein [Planctomycetota bacterium]|jgi:hypothetical protein
MASEWIGFQATKDKQPCGPARWRYLEDGRIEIQGQGSPTRAWPSEINQWTDLINKTAAKYGIEPHHLAALMGIESGGRPGLCLKCKSKETSGCNHSGECNHREGMGLMAVTLTTAKAMNNGKGLTEQQLRFDNELNLDLGAKYLRYQLDRNRNDYVHAAVAYNAGSVRCGRGGTFSSPKEACPPDQFGVVQGCVRTSKPYKGLVCAPSVLVPGKYNCTVNYPLNAIKMANSAVEHFLGKKPLPPPGPQPVTPTAQSAMLTNVAFIGAGVLLGYAAYELLGSIPGRRSLA